MRITDTRSWTRLLAALLLAGGTLTAAACGSDDDKGGDADVTEDVSGGDDAADDDAADDDAGDDDAGDDDAGDDDAGDDDAGDDDAGDDADEDEVTPPEECTDGPEFDDGDYLLGIRLPFDNQPVLFQFSVEGDELSLLPLVSDNFLGEPRDEFARDVLTFTNEDGEEEAVEAITFNMADAEFDDANFEFTFADVPFSNLASGSIAAAKDTTVTITLSGSACGEGSFCGSAALDFEYPKSVFIDNATFGAFLFDEGGLADAPATYSCESLDEYLDSGVVPEPEAGEGFEPAERDAFDGHCAEAPDLGDDFAASFFAVIDLPIAAQPMLARVEIAAETAAEGDDVTYSAKAFPLRLDAHVDGLEGDWDARTEPATFDLSRDFPESEFYITAGDPVEPFEADSVTVDDDGRFVINFGQSILHRDANPLARYEARGTIELTGMFCGAEAEFVCGGVTGGALDFPIAVDFSTMPITFGAISFEGDELFEFDAAELGSCDAIDAYEFDADGSDD